MVPWAPVEGWEPGGSSAGFGLSKIFLLGQPYQNPGCCSSSHFFPNPQRPFSPCFSQNKHLVADRTGTNRLPSEVSFTAKEQCGWLTCDSSSPLREEKGLTSSLGKDRGEEVL